MSQTFLFVSYLGHSVGKKVGCEGGEFQEGPRTVFSWSQHSLYETSSCLRFMFLKGFKKYYVDMLFMWMMELG